MSHLLGVAYTVNQASYDLARLRLNGLIARRPGPPGPTPTTSPPTDNAWPSSTPKSHDRLLRPLIAADQPPAPPQVQRALATIDRHVHNRINHARLPEAA